MTCMSSSLVHSCPCHVRLCHVSFLCVCVMSLFLAAESEHPGLDSVPISKIGRLDVQSRKQVVEYRFSSAHPRVCISPPQKSFEKSS